MPKQDMTRVPLSMRMQMNPLLFPKSKNIIVAPDASTLRGTVSASKRNRQLTADERAALKIKKAVSARKRDRLPMALK